MSTAQDERARLADLLAEVGPDQPTLCGEWTTRDLTAHLLLRERRPDAAPGILVGAFCGYTARVQQGISGQDWSVMVRDLRSGPPVWSPFRLLDRLVNAAEYLVHHEDVRRGRAGWEPRSLPAALQHEAWRLVSGLARLSYRRSPVGVVLRSEVGGTPGKEMTPKQGPRPVTLTGEPLELLLHAFGRDEVRVRFDGEDSDVAAVQALSRGF